MMLQLLLVEDDRTIASGLQYSLEQEQYQVELCYDKASAVQAIEQRLGELALCIFDLSLPDGSGYELCKLVKARRDIPVLFLSAVDDEVNIVMGLDMGADDYITKPFRVRELLSRIRTVLRRYQANGQSAPVRQVLEFGDVRIYMQEGIVYKQGAEVPLTALEYRLLLIFANHQGQVLSREQLLGQIWDVAGDYVNDNTLTVYIKRLREKLETDPQQPSLITTVRGIGYRLGGRPGDWRGDKSSDRPGDNLGGKPAESLGIRAVASPAATIRPGGRQGDCQGSPRGGQ